MANKINKKDSRMTITNGDLKAMLLGLQKKNKGRFSALTPYVVHLILLGMKHDSQDAEILTMQKNA